MFESNTSVEDKKNNSSSNTPFDTGQSQFEKILLTVWRYVAIVVILIWLVILICCRPVYEYKINHYKPLKPDKIENKIRLKHLGCSIDVIINHWANDYQSMQFYQFCNLDNINIYGNCHRKCKSNGGKFCICKRRVDKLFDKPNIENDSPEGYVLDAPDRDSPDENKLYYTEITKEEFKNGRNKLQFSDQPRGDWSDKYDKDNNHPLLKIIKKQNFKLFFVGKKENDQLDTFQSWEWGYEMFYLNGKQKYKLKYLIFTDEKLPEHLINLPYANNCVFAAPYPKGYQLLIR